MTPNHQIFAALGDATRFAIFDRLARGGPQPASALQDVADISAPAISRHLKVLRNAGLIEQTVAGQSRIYAVNKDVVERIGDWTVSYREYWTQSLDRLERELVKGWPI
ncbi:MAG: ArsR/SmtB family transcription factor [Planktomarina sp.]